MRNQIHKDINKQRDEKGRFKEGIVPHNYRRYKIPSLSDSEELAYIFGVMCGDGSLIFTRRSKLYPKGIQLTTSEAQFAKKFMKIANKLGFPAHVYPDGIYIKVMILSADLCRFFLEYNTRCEDWDIPSDILNTAKLNVKANFLRGFFDSEAYVDKLMVSMDSINHRGLCRLQQLLRNLNVLSHVYGPYVNNHGRKYYRLTMYNPHRRNFLRLIKFGVNEESNYA